MLDKKKIEMYEITKQKITALRNSIESHFINEPQLIGCIPGIEQQESIAFDCWLNKYDQLFSQMWSYEVYLYKDISFNA